MKAVVHGDGLGSKTKLCSVLRPTATRSSTSTHGSSRQLNLATLVSRNRAKLGPSQTITVGSDGPTMLALSPRSNPATGAALRVDFSLPTGSAARLELLDVLGRVVVEKEVGGLGAGPH